MTRPDFWCWAFRQLSAWGAKPGFGKLAGAGRSRQGGYDGSSTVKR